MCNCVSLFHENISTKDAQIETLGFFSAASLSFLRVISSSLNLIVLGVSEVILSILLLFEFGDEIFFLLELFLFLRSIDKISFLCIQKLLSSSDSEISY